MTHQIIRMERAETKNSKSPMWRCETDDGTRVNVFAHEDPVKDNFSLFVSAGYGEPMTAMDVGETRTWLNHPIPVTLRKDGQWWAIDAVPRRIDGVEPDPWYVPDLNYWRNLARDFSVVLLNGNSLPGMPKHVMIDVETTGLEADDEIVALAAFAFDGNSIWPVICTLVQPHDPQKLLRVQRNGKAAADVNGIQVEQLVNAKPFISLSYALGEIHQQLWAGWNVAFDAQMIWRACERDQMQPVVPLAHVDVMDLFAWYSGAWDAKVQQWQRVSLSKAADWFGITHERAHEAEGDVMMAYRILRLMAARAEEMYAEPF